MWKNKFSKLLFSNEMDKIDTKRAIKLKFNNFPSKLYKYRSFDDNGHSLDMLKENRIWVSDPTNFNDPYDCALQLFMKDIDDDYLKKSILTLDDKELKKAFQITQKELNRLKKSENFAHDIFLYEIKRKFPKYKYPYISYEEKVNEELNKFKNNNAQLNFLKKKIYLSCFSETNKSILMWSHYSNNHEGFCLEYNFKKLGINNYLNRFLFPVNYTNNILNLALYVKNDEEELRDIIFEYSNGIDLKKYVNGLITVENATNMNNMVLFHAASTKFEDWSYEKEWRFIFPYNHKKEDFNLKITPNAIYLGAMISNSHKKTILKLAKNKKIPVYQMEMNPTEFILEPNLIQP